MAQTDFVLLITTYSESSSFTMTIPPRGFNESVCLKLDDLRDTLIQLRQQLVDLTAEIETYVTIELPIPKRMFQLRLNPKKCTFGVTTGNMLGFLITKRGIEVDPSNIEAITAMSPPRSEKEVRGFIGKI
ncbi:uncharacterized protein LOC124943502 [Impatiens glandulifera]|uniref:uncharacterized protein LOC124943502 n=1 Tax=Impatiens glandulifera TaxID=253017 RepID=UPI001FB0F20B|nr:uncharacterized protein LOC124943502 [Impatiens glandulifera]